MLENESIQKARIMRKNGLTLQEISHVLNIAKSTASLWCKNIILSKKQSEKIKESQFKKLEKGRKIGTEKNKNKRILAIKEAELYGKKIINNINKKELSLVATALYWGEGSKSLKSTGFQFINSDPDMMLLMRKFLLEIIKIDKSDIFCSIQINKVHEKRIGEVLKFWKSLLDLRDEQIRKPYFVKTKARKLYQNHNKYYGICRLAVRRSSGLKYKMLGLIKALKDVNLTPV